MFKYELILLLPNKEEVQTVKKIITDSGAAIKQENSWGEKRLAYKIKKYQTAYYHILKIAFKNKQSVLKLKKQLNFNEKLIRYLLLVSEK